MFPSRNPNFFDVSEAFKDVNPLSRSSSASSVGSTPSSGFMMPLASLPSTYFLEQGTSRQIFGRREIEEPFPVDTVNQIFNDIEKLFMDDPLPDTPPFNPFRRSEADSKTTSKYLPTNLSILESSNINNAPLSGTSKSSEKSYTTEQYIQLCSNELTKLDDILSESKSVKTTDESSFQAYKLCYGISGTSNVPFLTQHKLIISKSSVDGFKTVDAVTLNGLHNFISRIFSLYDKLQAFIQKNSPSGLLGADDAEQKKHLNEIFEQWYTLGMNLKDRLVAVNSFPELSLTLAAFQPKQIAKLCRLTRLLRTFVWTRKNLATGTLSSNDAFARDMPNQSNDQQSSSSTRRYSYFGK